MIVSGLETADDENEDLKIDYIIRVLVYKEFLMTIFILTEICMYGVASR